MSKTRSVVTGGSGFVGGHLVKRLLARGDEVTVFDTGFPAEEDGSRRIMGDVRDRDRLAEAIPAGTDVVYHLAAVVGVDQYLARPLDVIDINVTGTRNVLECAARAGAKVVLASTSEVFGKNPQVPWAEDADRVLGPTSAARWTYSTSKALAEHMTLAFADRHGLDATIVRYFNAYGPSQRPAYLVSRSIHRVLGGLPPVIYDDGAQTRCLTYIDDIVTGTLLAASADKAAGEAFNLGSMTELTVRDIINMIVSLAGEGVEPITANTAQHLGSAYEDLGRRMPDNTKARELLGWECSTAVDDGLAQTIAWARQNPWWLALPGSGAS
ncbi:NAD-dependent epimerase/dehydratase family protein [Streptomyces sp. RerS4]|uniref:NAD-dependent epimerase/dehydratase family protein n=1 Tax=Streptomyces sp. RerS4 TaxID=2942449 RepID=UPI00201C4D3D|nr:NAD-dependent epimerase/dehydratase family protein [Streptomyces sp. RerS4]UQX03434.1 NAD-dependent epimerase/dehydratase family protein [Streptomyces sp. RerS4]